MLDISEESLIFLQKAISDGVKVSDLVINPKSFERYSPGGLSDVQISEVSALGQRSQREAQNPLSPSARDFLREVVVDGRYILDWSTRPSEVADIIGYEINPDIIDEITRRDLTDFTVDVGTEMRGLALVSVAIAVIVAANGLTGLDETVIDFSKIEKL
jgi:hypothetical protein